MQRQREGGQRAGWYERGKPSKRPIPGILARARRHVDCAICKQRNRNTTLLQTCRQERTRAGTSVREGRRQHRCNMEGKPTRAHKTKLGRCCSVLLMGPKICTQDASRKGRGRWKEDTGKERQVGVGMRAPKRAPASCRPAKSNQRLPPAAPPCCEQLINKLIKRELINIEIWTQTCQRYSWLSCIHAACKV